MLTYILVYSANVSSQFEFQLLKYLIKLNFQHEIEKEKFDTRKKDHRKCGWNNFMALSKFYLSLQSNVTTELMFVGIPL